MAVCEKKTGHCAGQHGRGACRDHCSYCMFGTFKKLAASQRTALLYGKNLWLTCANTVLQVASRVLLSSLFLKALLVFFHLLVRGGRCNVSD